MTDAFVLDLSSRSGEPVLELQDGGVAIHEWTTWLRIRSDITGFVPPTIDPEADELTGFVPPVFEEDGLALLVVVRDFDDIPGQSIGLFHARLDADELQQLREIIEGTPWADLPRPTGGDYNAPHLELAYERGSTMIRRGFNARSSNFIAAISTLWGLLDKAMTRAYKGPASLLALKLEAGPASEDEPLELELRLALSVRGIGSVALTDPRLPPRPGDPPRLRVQVAERISDNPHAALGDAIELAIPAPEPDAPAVRVIRAPSSFRLELPFVAPRPGRYRILARWQDYRGPIEPVAGLTSLMPLPAQGDSSLGSGPYPIFGAVFASLDIEVGK